MGRRWRIAALVAAVLVVIGGGVATFLVVSDEPTSPSAGGTASPSAGATSSPSAGVTIPPDGFQPYTWGYVGCSNTRGTISGYHLAPDTAHLFWPIEGYPIAGKTVSRWLDPNRPTWQLFDQMKQRQNGGADPPVVWVQMCTNIDARRANEASVTYEDIVQMIEQVRAHAPDSMIFVSPLQSYDPPTLCPKMGPDGQAIPTMTSWLDQAVEEGLALPGPGVGGIPNLGPLTQQNTQSDGCHPSHRDGAVFLGSQLAEFFDALQQS